MKSIIDYIKKYGDKTIDEMPFNEVDSLILSQISYLKFDNILPGPTDNVPGVEMAKIPEHECYEELYEDRRFIRNNRALFSNAAKSARFGNVRLNNYISMTDTDWQIQFSALSATFEGGLTYLAFRGTDETLIGWKEDFNMALVTPVPAQEKAKQYLNTFGLNSAGKIILGGHSKGGNMAVYAASTCQPELRDRIIKIYNHDGPGFPADTILETEGFLAVKDKILKFMPHSSIVGMIMETAEAYEIVECRKYGILQHDPFNWVVDGTAFRRVDNVYKYVRFKDASINKWICDMTIEEKSIFVEQLYSIFTASGATTLNELNDDWMKSSMAMLAAIENIDEASRDNLRKVITTFVEAAAATVLNHIM